MSINCVCIILNVEFRFVYRKPREREFKESKKTDPDIIVSFNVTGFQGTQGSRVLSRSIIKLFDVCEFTGIWREREGEREWERESERERERERE